MKAQFKPRIFSGERPKLEEHIPLDVPFIINVDPADICNLQCVFCPTGDRNLMRKTDGRYFGLLDFSLFQKIVNDICEFERPLKVLRLYKDGEPLLHPQFPEMVRYAKEKGCADIVDTTTNASRLSPELGEKIIEAGLDSVNISVYGMNSEQYQNFSKARVDFSQLVQNVKSFYENSRGKTRMLVKINGDAISEDDQKRFLDTFGDITDQIFIEHIMSCWPTFDLQQHGVQANPNMGLYGQPIKEVAVCPYVFYSFSINSNGTASACFLDWQRKLIIGDVKNQSIKEIWNSAALLAHQKMMLMKERKQHPICGNCDQLRRGQPDDIDVYAEELLVKVNEK